MVISVKKEIKKNNKKSILNKIKNINIKKILSKIKNFFQKYYYIILIALPFILIDLITRILGRKINFFSIGRLVPNLFTLIWVFLMIGICLFLEKKKGKILYIFFFFFCIKRKNTVYFFLYTIFSPFYNQQCILFNDKFIL